MITKFNEFINESVDNFELKYEPWKWGGYSEGHQSWNLYKNGKLIAAVSNDNDDENNMIIRHIESKEKGMATKLIFMLLDNGVVLETGKPNYNSISTAAYHMNNKINKLIEDSGKYKSTTLGKANNKGKEDQEKYKDVIDIENNYHYRWEK